MKQLPFFLFCLFFNQLAAQWTTQADSIFGPNTLCCGIDALDENSVWASYSIGTTALPTQRPWVIHTKNGGAKWQYDSISGTVGYVAGGIFAADTHTVWITLKRTDDSTQNALYRTTDGGKTWQLRHKSPAAGQNIHFFDKQHGLLINGNQYSLTADGGLTWSALKVFKVTQPYMSFPPGQTIEAYGNTVWIPTANARLARSTDQGKTWELLDTPVTKDSISIGPMAFSDEKNGLAFINYTSEGFYRFAQTSDGGTTWDTLSATTILPEPWGWFEFIAPIPGEVHAYIARGIWQAPPDYLQMQQTFRYDDNGWTPLTQKEPLSFGAYLGKRDFVSLKKGWIGLDVFFAATQPVITDWNQPGFAGQVVTPNPATPSGVLEIPLSKAQYPDRVRAVQQRALKQKQSVGFESN